MDVIQFKKNSTISLIDDNWSTESLLKVSIEIQSSGVILYMFFLSKILKSLIFLSNKNKFYCLDSLRILSSFSLYSSAGYHGLLGFGISHTRQTLFSSGF